MLRQQLEEAIVEPTKKYFDIVKDIVLNQGFDWGSIDKAKIFERAVFWSSAQTVDFLLQNIPNLDLDAEHKTFNIFHFAAINPSALVLKTVCTYFSERGDIYKELKDGTSAFHISALSLIASSDDLTELSEKLTQLIDQKPALANPNIKGQTYIYWLALIKGESVLKNDAIRNLPFYDEQQIFHGLAHRSCLLSRQAWGNLTKEEAIPDKCINEYKKAIEYANKISSEKIRNEILAYCYYKIGCEIAKENMKSSQSTIDNVIKGYNDAIDCVNKLEKSKKNNTIITDIFKEMIELYFTQYRTQRDVDNTLLAKALVICDQYINHLQTNPHLDPNPIFPFISKAQIFLFNKRNLAKTEQTLTEAAKFLAGKYYYAAYVQLATLLSNIISELLEWDEFKKKGLLEWEKLKTNGQLEWDEFKESGLSEWKGLKESENYILNLLKLINKYASHFSNDEKESFLLTIIELCSKLIEALDASSKKFVSALIDEMNTFTNQLTDPFLLIDAYSHLVEAALANIDKENHEHVGALLNRMKIFNDQLPNDNDEKPSFSACYRSYSKRYDDFLRANVPAENKSVEVENADTKFLNAFLELFTDENFDNKELKLQFFDLLSGILMQAKSFIESGNLQQANQILHNSSVQTGMSTLKTLSEYDPMPHLIYSELENIYTKFSLELNLSNKIHQQYGLQCVDVPGDGSCFFHAIADQLKTQKILIKGKYINHQQLREMTAKHIEANASFYAPFIANSQAKEAPGDGNCFFHAQKILLGDESTDHLQLRKITANHLSPSQAVAEHVAGLRTTAWGDHIDVAALARALNVTIVVFQATDNSRPEIFKPKNSMGTIYLGFLGHTTGLHYESLRPLNANLSNEQRSALDELIQNADILAPIDQQVSTAQNQKEEVTSSTGSKPAEAEVKGSEKELSPAARAAYLRSMMINSNTTTTESAVKPPVEEVKKLRQGN